MPSLPPLTTALEREVFWQSLCKIYYILFFIARISNACRFQTVRPCCAKCCADRVSDSPHSKLLAVKMRSKKCCYQCLTGRTWGLVRQCSKSKIAWALRGRARSWNRGLGCGHKIGLKPTKGGQLPVTETTPCTAVWFLTVVRRKRTCGTTNVKLCKNVHAPETFLTPLMHNGSEKGFETKFGSKNKLDFCPLH